MTTEQLRRYKDARPFRPFDIFMADGRRLTVPHPELIMLSPSGRTIIVGMPDDTFEIVDLLLVTSLKVSEIASAQAQSSG
jgi:hypothetical protein